MGRRGRLLSIVRLRGGSIASVSIPGSDCEVSSLLLKTGWGGGGWHGTSSMRKARGFGEFEADGDSGLEDGKLEPHGLRARLTSLPDIARALEGRATGSGGFVSGIFKRTSGASELGDTLSSSSFSADSVTRETATARSLFFERMDVRRRISFPAATSSFVGDGVWLGEVKSEKVLRNGGETGPVTSASGRFW